jgi:hypothetical protein
MVKVTNLGGAGANCGSIATHPETGTCTFAGVSLLKFPGSVLIETSIGKLAL